MKTERALLALTSVRPFFFLSSFSVVRPTQIFGISKKKSNDIVKPFFNWNNSFNLKTEHSNSIEQNRNKNKNIFYSILCILLIQICKCQLLTLSWGTRASYSEISSDFFFQSDRPTQNQEMHSTLNEKEGGDGPKLSKFIVKTMSHCSLHRWLEHAQIRWVLGFMEPRNSRHLTSLHSSLT